MLLKFEPRTRIRILVSSLLSIAMTYTGCTSGDNSQNSERLAAQSSKTLTEVTHGVTNHSIPLLTSNPIAEASSLPAENKEGTGECRCSATQTSKDPTNKEMSRCECVNKKSGNLSKGECNCTATQTSKEITNKEMACSECEKKPDKKGTGKLAVAAPSKNSKDDECGCTPAQISKPFTNVAKKATPAVVFIKVESNGNDLDDGFPDGSPNPYDNFGDDFLRRFFGAPPRGQQKPMPQLSQGSGFLVSSDGYIMTNAHVIAGSDKISVVLHDGREIDGVLIGSDPNTDVAVIKIEGKDYPYVEFGNSDDMDIGEWVIAIGSPFQLQASLTVGVISAKGRQNLRITDLEDFIQTDAAINPGNSGGPLLNLHSQVIGINTAIVSRSGGYMGIGFAIPSNMAKNIMTQIIDKGAVTRGFLGVSLQPVDKDIAEAFNLDKIEGALVSEVVKDSPADKGGLKQGDIILEYNNTPIKSLGGFRNDISLMEPGSTVTMKVNRKGQIMTIKIQLGKASDARSASGISQQIGFEVSNLTPDIAKQLGYDASVKGVVITKIKPGSAAALAGMRPGFVIKEINDQQINNIEEFNKVLDELGTKKTIKLLVKQGNADRYYSIKLN